MLAKNIVFDLDGTLIDSMPGIALSINLAIAEVCPERKATEVGHLIGPPLREVFRRALLLEDNNVLTALEEAFRRSYDGGNWRQTRLYDGVTETLAKLRATDCRLFIVTNKPPMPTERILRHFDLWTRFDEVVTILSRQPPFATKAAATDDLQRRHDLSASHTVFVGDSADDGAAAEACGFKFAAVTFGYGRAYRECDSPVHFRLERFEDLLNIL